MGLVSMLIFSQISDSMERNQKISETNEAIRRGFNSINEMKLYDHKQDLYLRNKWNEYKWIYKIFKINYKKMYKQYLNTNMVDDIEDIKFEKLLINNWDYTSDDFESNLKELSKKVCINYILLKNIFKLKLSKYERIDHEISIRNEILDIINKVINYQEAEKTSKLQKEKVDNEVNIAKQQLETLELQKQIIDNQTNLTKEQLKINAEIHSSNLKYIDVFKNNKEKENGR